MKKICLIILILALALPLLPQEPVADHDNPWYRAEKNRFSLGLNNLPWNASRLSFRWWRNRSSGHEFTISISTRADISSPQSSGIHIRELRYDRLWRKRSRYIRGLYHVGGFGLGGGLDSILRTPDSSSVKNSFDGYLQLYIPLGIEHFFLKSFSRLSYSIQLDFYGRVNYRRINHSDDWKERWGDLDTDEWSISLGLKLQFFIRLYLG
jgi:hypothetical protein